MAKKNPTNYREGSTYDVIVREGRKHAWKSRRLLAQHCARLLRMSEELVMYSVNVVCNHKQLSNGGRSMAVEVPGGIRIKVLTPEPAKA